MLDDTRTATIAAGATGKSGVVDIQGYSHAGFFVGSDWTDAATQLYFEACNTSTGTFLPVYDDEGNRIKVAVQKSRAITGVYGAISLPAFRYIKICSVDADGVAVNQTNSPTVTIQVK